MSWLYSRVLAEAYSEGGCLGGAPSALSSSTPTPQVYLSHGKMTDFLRLFRFGMTCELLTADNGAALLTWFRAGFPAKTLAPPGAGQELTASDPACGRTLLASLARYDRDTRLWKIPQCSLVEGLDVFSGTWPRWGMMRDGVSWELSRPARLTSDIESGSGLRGVPTPLAKGNYNNSKTGYYDGLLTWAKKFPTPPTVDARSLVNKSAAVGGSLNPTWVEWLMGWPLGWTELGVLATGKFRLWRRLHGGC